MFLSTGPHVASTLTNPTRPAVFFWYFFIAAKIPRAAGGKLLKTPQAPGLTSKQLSSFFTHCFQDPRLFSPRNQILLEIFLSDITIYRTLALDIMFISDLYMSTWPIKFISHGDLSVGYLTVLIMCRLALLRASDSRKRENERTRIEALVFCVSE